MPTCRRSALAAVFLAHLSLPAGAQEPASTAVSVNSVPDALAAALVDLHSARTAAVGEFAAAQRQLADWTGAFEADGLAPLDDRGDYIARETGPMRDRSAAAIARIAELDREIRTTSAQLAAEVEVTGPETVIVNDPVDVAHARLEDMFRTRDGASDRFQDNFRREIIDGTPEAAAAAARDAARLDAIDRAINAHVNGMGKLIGAYDRIQNCPAPDIARLSAHARDWARIQEEALCGLDPGSCTRTFYRQTECGEWDAVYQIAVATGEITLFGDGGETVPPLSDEDIVPLVP